MNPDDIAQKYDALMKSDDPPPIRIRKSRKPSEATRVTDYFFDLASERWPFFRPTIQDRMAFQKTIKTYVLGGWTLEMIRPAMEAWASQPRLRARLDVRQTRLHFQFLGWFRTNHLNFASEPDLTSEPAVMQDGPTEPAKPNQPSKPNQPAEPDDDHRYQPIPRTKNWPLAIRPRPQWQDQDDQRDDQHHGEPTR